MSGFSGGGGLPTPIAVANGGTGQTSYTDGQLLIGNTTGNTLTKATLTAGTNITITNSGGGISIAAAAGGAAQTVTRQLFTTGTAATYTTPGNCSLLRILIIAGGGGSGGLGAGAGTGGVGGTTTFNSITAIGGSGGTGTSTTTGGVGGIGGTGGTGTLGTGGFRVKGGDGSDGGNVVGAIAQVPGGVGGVTRLGGFQAASASNNGAGADGDNSASVLTGGSGAGGGGEVAEIIITSPAATYTYTVGAGGAAGAGATAGLAGNPGMIIVDEFYGTTAMTLTNHQVLLGTGSGIGVVSGTGTAGQVLTSNGASADPTFQQPAMVLISEVVTSASQASVTFSSIATTYRDLEIRVRGRGDTAAGVASILLQFNGDTGGNYNAQQQRTASTATDFSQTTSQTSIKLTEIPAATATASHAGAATITVYDYRGTTFFKVTTSALGNSTGTGTFSQAAAVHSGQWMSTAAINAVKVFLSAGNFVDNSVVSLYGRM